MKEQFEFKKKIQAANASTAGLFFLNTNAYSHDNLFLTKRLIALNAKRVLLAFDTW